MYDDQRHDSQPQQAEEFFDNEPDAGEAYGELQHEPADESGAQPLELIAQMHTGANWFYWIAVLSIVNSVIIASGAEWNFVVGLGITQIVDGIAAAVAQGMEGNAAMIVTGIALAISITIAGMFAGMGYLANRAHTWVFILGMLVYAGDGLIFLLFQDWLSVGFHAFALFGLFSGLKAAQQIRQFAVDTQFQLAAEAS